jgi:tRNA-dihydrouridine synthase
MEVAGVMIGRAALQNPAIFDLLKNKIGLNSPEIQLPNFDELIKEYMSLFAVFGSEMYKSNFLRMLGKDVGSELY